MLIELNARYPMGLAAVSEPFRAPWHRYLGQAGVSRQLIVAAAAAGN